MSVADEVEDHQARCVAALVSLQLLTRQDAGEPVPRRVVLQIAQATRTVLAEARAAAKAVLSAGDGGDGNPGERTFLRVRLERLQAAAEDAITAARAGDPGEVSRQLRRFDALTAAIWTVQDALCGSRPVSAGR